MPKQVLSTYLQQSLEALQAFEALRVQLPSSFRDSAIYTEAEAYYLELQQVYQLLYKKETALRDEGLVLPRFQ